MSREVLTGEAVRLAETPMCPNCEHQLAEHLVETGCDNGWDAWHSGDPGAPDPCECPLSLAFQYGPPSEHGGRRYA